MACTSFVSFLTASERVACTSLIAVLTASFISRVRELTELLSLLFSSSPFEITLSATIFAVSFEPSSRNKYATDRTAFLTGR